MINKVFGFLFMLCPFMAVTSPIFTREMLEKFPLKTVEPDLDSSFFSPGFRSGRMRPNYCRLEFARICTWKWTFESIRFRKIGAAYFTADPIRKKDTPRSGLITIQRRAFVSISVLTRNIGLEC